MPITICHVAVGQVHNFLTGLFDLFQDRIRMTKLLCVPASSPPRRGNDDEQFDTKLVLKLAYLQTKRRLGNANPIGRPREAQPQLFRRNILTGEYRMSISYMFSLYYLSIPQGCCERHWPLGQRGEPHAQK